MAVSPLPALLDPTTLDASQRSRFDRIGDRAFRLVTLAAAAGAIAILVAIAYKVFELAAPSIGKFGLGFVSSHDWNAVTNKFGGLDFIWGTAFSSLVALIIAAPISIAIALFLTELAPTFLRTPIGALVEVLSGIPSVVIGLWGILVMGPFVEHQIEPFLNSFLGWIPLFSGRFSPVGLLPAVLVLTIMIVPIVASISRELFARVPKEQVEGALALGATRWEMIRGVMIPYVGPGLVAALILGLGRAIGEAIAVTQVIGVTAGVHWSLFGPADTLASRIAGQFQGAVSNLQVASLGYLAAILLVLSLIFNLGAQLIIRRVEQSRR
jgi:phosphate transport system permease protein